MKGKREENSPMQNDLSHLKHILQADCPFQVGQTEQLHLGANNEDFIFGKSFFHKTLIRFWEQL